MADNEGEVFISCDVCNIPFTGIEPYVQHLKGKKHQKLLKQKGLPKGENSPLDPEGGIYHCNFCGVSLPDMTVYNEHLLTAEHLEKVRESQGRPKEDPPELQCELCKKTFNNTISQEQHLRSRPHEKALKKAMVAARLSTDVEKPLDSEDLSSDDILGSIGLKEFGSCTICSKTFGGPESYEQHMDSNGHKKKVLQQRLKHKLKEKHASETEESNACLPEETQDPKESEFSCLDCDKKFSGAVPYAQHIQSNIHMRQLHKKRLLESLAHPAMPELENEPVLPEDVQGADPLRNPILTCDYCKMSFTGPESCKAHLDSKKHWRIVRMARFIEQRKKSKNHEEKTANGEMQPVVSTDDVGITETSNREPATQPPDMDGNDTSLPTIDESSWTVMVQNNHLYGPKVLNCDPNSDDSLKSVDKKIHIDSINFPTNPQFLGSEGIVTPSAPTLDGNDGSLEGNDGSLEGNDGSLEGNDGSLELPSYDSLAAEKKVCDSGLVDDASNEVPGEYKPLYPQLDDPVDQPTELGPKGHDEPQLATEVVTDSSASPSEEESQSAAECSKGKRKNKKKKTQKCKGLGMGKFVASVVSILD